MRSENNSSRPFYVGMQISFSPSPTFTIRGVDKPLSQYFKGSCKKVGTTALSVLMHKPWAAVVQEATSQVSQKERNILFWPGIAAHDNVTAIRSW